jgi:hypothetical protein
VKSNLTAGSPVEKAVISLETVNPKWRVDIGVPDDSPSWIRGTDFTRANEGPLQSLLSRIADRLRTSDRKTIAASFALRFGWTASAAIGPYLVHNCVPDISLANVSFRFGDNTLFERTAIHSPLGSVLSNNPGSAHPLTRSVEEPASLLRLMRSELKEQANPVVDTLYEWSGLSKRSTWGLVTSSWAALFVHVYDHLGCQPEVLPIITAFFQGDDPVASMQPKLYPVTLRNVTHLYQRRSSCCRYYSLPHGSFCASCPLLSKEEREARNLEWMREQLASKPK